MKGQQITWGNLLSIAATLIAGAGLWWTLTAAYAAMKADIAVLQGQVADIRSDIRSLNQRIVSPRGAPEPLPWWRSSP